ncbi:MAG: aminoglycoside phosphotransferase family protein [Ginsengibacter sp.]
MNTTNNVKQYLIEGGLVKKIDKPVLENLGGGVSSSVWLCVLNNNTWVIKQALDKLKVEDDWFSDVERIHREHEVMDALSVVLPTDVIPNILHVDYIDHIYIMEYVKEAQTWKDILMKGIFSVTVAENVAQFLLNIHVNSARIDDCEKAKFQDQKYFIQLRVDPFHRFLMQKYPELSSSIQKLIDEVTCQNTCLVHGDFSPKNILVKKDNSVVLIDFEVAHWGNPVFDLAYCLGHLMLKGWYLNKPEQILKLVKAFLAVYKNELNNLIPHLGLMLLARIDGKSRVSYIVEEDMKNVIRKVAIDWIENKNLVPDTLQNIRNAFQIDF